MRSRSLWRITINSGRFNLAETLIIGIHTRFNHTETVFGTNHTENAFGTNLAENVFGKNLPPQGVLRQFFASADFFTFPLECRRIVS